MLPPSPSPRCKASHGHLSCETAARCQEGRGVVGLGLKGDESADGKLPDYLIKASHDSVLRKPDCTLAILPLLPGSAIFFATSVL